MECNMTAILLSVHESGTADRIAVFFSKEKGKVRVFCPGNRRKNNRGGFLSLFSEMDLQLRLIHGNYQLIESQLIQSHPKILEDLERLTYGSIIAESVENFWPEEESQEEVYLFLQQAFAMMGIRSPRITAGVALWKILELAGFAADFDHCMQCGESIEKGTLEAGEGGFLGSCCGAGTSGYPVNEDILTIFRDFQKYPWNGAEIQKSIRGQDLIEAEKILLTYLDYYLEKPLKSLQFLQKMERGKRNLLS